MTATALGIIRTFEVSIALAFFGHVLLSWVPEDCDGRFPVLRRDIAAFLGHDAVILQDLLEGRDIQHGVRLLHYGGNASRRPVQHVVWNIL